MEQNTYLGLSVAGFHQLAYSSWGQPGGRVTLCVHGLTRNSHDFDYLAAQLAARGRFVACPDVVGRGQSDWLPRPELYGYPQALADMTALLARLGATEVDWIGTSMGGLIGLMLAAQPHTPIRKLVLNDVGPFIPKAALERLAGYVGSNPHFADLTEAEAYFRRVHAPFGITQDEDWRDLTRHSVRVDPAGGYRLCYDPAIAHAFAGPLVDVNLWPLWDLLNIPVLVLRGEESDLLLPDTALEMTRRGPRAQLVQYPNCGHAPALLDSSRIEPILMFLDGPRATSG